jgi:hypothetical protein
MVIPEPVVTDGWLPGSEFASGSDASTPIRLAPGRWNLSLQYHSEVPIELEGSGLDEELPPSLDGMFAFAPGRGPFWPAGEINVKGDEPLEVTVRQQPLSGLQKLLGVERNTWLGELAATRPGGGEQIPLSQACGRYVDWFTVEK